MFEKIKLILYQKGLFKLDTLEKKIEYLIKHFDKINLYSKDFRNVYEDFLEKDIVRYIETLRFILRSSLETKPISINPITDSSYYRITYSFWYSNQGEIINNNETLKEWLQQALQFIKWGDVAKKDYNKAYNSSNFRKLSPYYLNITNIIDTLINALLVKK